MTVELVKHAASDADVIWAARVSTKGEQSLADVNADAERSAGLINFLMRDRHGTPFEHSSMTFYVNAPIFVFREFMRHRTFSYNEESGRYRKLDPVFYVPGPDRKLVQSGKPGAYVFTAGSPEQHALVTKTIESSCHQSYEAYLEMLDAGVAREVARSVLPVGLYSSMYATCNARALMNFLSLRVAHPDSAFPSFPQREIEMVAEQMEALWTALMPLTHAAFDGTAGSAHSRHWPRCRRLSVGSRAMKPAQPEVFLVARPEIDYDQIAAYLHEVGGEKWLEKLDRGDLDDAQNLVEFAGKICYRAWEPGLNPNIVRVRNDQETYLQNILKQMHGSVLEHVSFSFVLHNISRVLTHELIRHRPGTAVSQESLRFVRLADIPFWFPEWAQSDAELMKRATALLEQMEEFQRWMAGHFGLDDEGVPFHEKKHKTSFMRRFAPDGVATGLLWTANVRTLRHTIEARTDTGAEEEIRLVFGKIAELMRAEAPALFGDYTVTDGAWIPQWRKV